MPALKNAKHEAVAQAFVKDPERVAFRAYLSVYPRCSEPAAKTAAGRLFKKADFRSRIAELTAAAAKKAGLSAAKVLDELCKLAFSNMLDYAKALDSGDLVLDFSKLTREQAAAIHELTVETYVEGGGEDAQTVKRTKFKLHNKRDALVDLGKHLGIFVERHKHEHTGADGGPIETKTIDDLSPNEIARRIAFVLVSAAPK